MLRYCFGNVKGLFGQKRFYGMISGKKAKVLGHVSMCNLVLDVTSIDAKIGDSVTFDINPLLIDREVLRLYV
ncbi:hypothetical protein SDC9_189585 [bioreactor metagenome]|uniref:Alanine racemase n=1 Tax=bioreactor metagenome TaxID=1076179 RepID=A0A645HV09_9ZZZZ